MIVVIVQRFWTVYPRLVTSTAAVRSNISDAGDKRRSSPISVSVVQGSLTSTVIPSATAKQVGSSTVGKKAERRPQTLHRASVAVASESIDISVGPVHMALTAVTQGVPRWRNQSRGKNVTAVVGGRVFLPFISR